MLPMIQVDRPEAKYCLHKPSYGRSVKLDFSMEATRIRVLCMCNSSQLPVVPAVGNKVDSFRPSCKFYLFLVYRSGATEGKQAALRYNINQFVNL